MIRKEIHNQDSYFKLDEVHSGESSLNISLDILNLIHPNLQQGNEEQIVFEIYKEDYISAIAYIAGKLPVYTSTSTSSTIVNPSILFFEKAITEIKSIFNDNESALYTINILYRNDGRVYLKNLECNGFNIRHFLLSENSILEFENEGGKRSIRLKSEPFDCIIREKTANNFGVAVCRYFWEYDRLSNLKPYFVVSTKSTNYTQIEYLGKILYRFLNPNLLDTSSPKWDNTPYEIDGNSYLFCHEWTESENNSSVPSIEILRLIVAGLYKGFNISKEDGFFVLRKTEKLLQTNQNDSVASKGKNLPLQQIYYGAPGTGKSHEINEQTKGQDVIRTTFHPDSDYSTFVGAYKPTSTGIPMRDVTGRVIKDANGDDVMENRIIYEFVDQAFLQAYIKAWEKQGKQIRTADGKYLLVDMDNEAIYWRNAKGDGGERNTAKKDTVRSYFENNGDAPAQNSIAKHLKGLDSDFEKAWAKLKNSFAVVAPQYLVIEEINRGNCAQIFGDLFQLLDRNASGFSEYPIQADNDMKKQLQKAFKGLTIAKAEEINKLYDGKDIVSEVLNGDCLLLPNNLYIWATMNTSDQSLFPIDSAFKRRWDWRYMPIDTEKESWKIRVNGSSYSWTSFLNIINEIVHEKTQSEDKQLGFYFCKAKNGVIDAETFVGKVLFYLWNDVFKDYGFDDDFFEDEKLADGTFKPLAFKSFYDVKTRKVMESQAEKFLLNLKVERIEDGKEDVDGGSKEDASAGGFLVRFKDGHTINEKRPVDTFVESIKYIAQRTSYEEVAAVGITHDGYPLLSKEQQNGTDSRQLGDNGEWWLMTRLKHSRKAEILQKISEKLQSLHKDLDLGMTIE